VTATGTGWTSAARGGMRSGGLEARLRFVFRVNIARVTLVLG
jgi:hypothetical protein